MGGFIQVKKHFRIFFLSCTVKRDILEQDLMFKSNVLFILTSPLCNYCRLKVYLSKEITFEDMILKILQVTLENCNPTEQ